MSFREKLAASWTKTNSLLCVGLDSDLAKLPDQLAGTTQPLLTFNKAIIDTTADLVSSYKANSAFYEALGPTGLEQLKLTTDYIHQNHPHLPVILDAKRADIGNTNNGYISYTFDYLGMDAVTLHPYLGKEALEPYLALKDKGLIILCRTSNPGAAEFQDLLVDGLPLYQQVAKQVANDWNANGNCLLVVGATYPEEMKTIRGLVGDMPFLVPGIGAQGGDVQATMAAGLDSHGQGMIIHSAREIIYASSGEDFAEAARAKALTLRDEINKYR